MSKKDYGRMRKSTLIREVKEYQEMLSEVVNLYIELQEVYMEFKGGRVEDIEDIEKRLKKDIKIMNLTMQNELKNERSTSSF